MSVVGFSLLAFGVLVMQNHQYGMPVNRGDLIAGGWIVAGIAVLCSGAYLVSRGTDTARLTQKATIALTLALLVGACAFMFTVATCLNPN
jgi:hypothetical protein